MKIPAKVARRLVDGLRKFQPILAAAKARDVNESDTVVLVTDILAEVLGYDKYTEITSEHMIRGTFCDLAVHVENDLAMLLEVKAIGLDLKDQHTKQAVDYAANKGCDWVTLTNGVEWRVYQVIFGKPIDKELIAHVNLGTLNHRTQADLEVLWAISKEGWRKSRLSEYAAQQHALSRFAIGAALLSDPVLAVLRRELRRVSPDAKVDPEQIKQVLVEEVIKRDVIEGDKATEAKRAASEAALTDFLAGHQGAPPIDSTATLACLRTRIGATAEPPRRDRFLMGGDEGWMEGALHVALAQAIATPEDLPTLRVLAYSAIAETFDRLAEGRFDPVRPLVSAAVRRLSEGAEAGVTDPLVLMSCAQLSMVLGNSADAFRCALAGAATPGDRTWYLTRMAWLLAEARQGAAAKAFIRLAALEAHSPLDRAEVAYVVVDADDRGPASLEPAWIANRLAALAPMSANDLRSFLLRLQPLGWEWARDRRPAPKPAECRSERIVSGGRPEVQVARMWDPTSLQPRVIAIARSSGKEASTTSGSFLFRSLGAAGAEEPERTEFSLSAAPSVVWQSTADVDPDAAGGWSFRPSAAGPENLGAFGALIPDTLSGSGPTLSDVVLTPAAFELSQDGPTGDFTLRHAEDDSQAAMVNVYVQTRSATDVAEARLDLTIAGCKSNLYQDRVHVTSDIAVPAGLREIRRAIGLTGLAAGEYQLRLLLKSASGEVLASSERAFRVD